MIEARNEIMRATPIEVASQPLDEHQEILEVLGQIEPPREADRALAKYAVQRSLRLPFTVGEHIECASPETEVRTWGKKCLQAFRYKFGNEDGFLVADLELEALMLDLEEVIYD